MKVYIPTFHKQLSVTAPLSVAAQSKVAAQSIVAAQISAHLTSSYTTKGNKISFKVIR